MAKCKYCGEEMKEADGCSCKYVKTTDERYFERYKVGDEGMYSEGERCGDCGALFGYYHHPCCDLEACPICHMQLFSCFCDIERFVKHKKVKLKIKQD